MNRSFLLLLPLSFVLANCETTDPDKRYYISSYRGMEKKTGPLGNTALVKESDPAVLKKYTRVIIEDVKVIPAKKSKTEKKNSINGNRAPATRAESERLAEKFEKILKEELSPHYQITTRRGYNTLIVRAALTELRPSDPGLFVVNYLPYAGIAATGVQLATGEAPGGGSTSFEAEVIDSRTRRQVYAIADQIKGGKLQVGGLAKWGQAEQAMRGWSRRIRLAIQKAEAPPKPAAPKKSSASLKKTTSTKKSSSTTKKPLFGSKKSS